MKTNRIGNTAARATEIAFGCSGIGNLFRAISDEEAAGILQHAWDAGIRYFDTAPHYGRGLSEERLGQFLTGRDRAEYTLSTKVGRLLSPGNPMSEADGFVAPLPNAVRYDYSDEGIEASFEQSCRRLGTSHIDIIYVHDIGAATHGPENARHLQDLFNTGLPRLQHLKSEGRIKAFGLGVNENEVCLTVMERASIDVILLAGRLTLLDRSAEDELVKRCLESNTSLVLGGIFNSGILATGPVPGANFDYRPASKAILARVSQLQEEAERSGTTLPMAALSFALRHPASSSVLLGTGQLTSLKRNLDMVEVARR